MNTLAMELLTEFDKKNIFSALDVHDLKIKLIIEARDSIFTDIGFHVTIRDFYHFDELGEIDAEQYLIGPESTISKQLKYMYDFPLKINGKSELIINLELDIAGPLIDVIKKMPEHLTNHEYSLCPETFELAIKCILTTQEGSELVGRLYEDIDNPYHARFLS